MRFDIRGGDVTQNWQNAMDAEQRTRERNTELQGRHSVAQGLNTEKVTTSAVKLSEFSSAAASAIASLSSISASSSGGGGGGGRGTFHFSGPGGHTGIMTVDDALITKEGRVIKFHPDDNILAFKGNGPKGGNNIYNTFNINGARDADAIADEIMKKIQRIGRIGF